MKKWIYTIFMFFLILASCKENKERIIPKKQLIDMMVDLYICDALAMNTYLCNQLGGIDSSVIYSSFISKYKYTKKDLDYTLKYYSAKPKKLTLIYDQVFAELSKKADDSQNVTKKFSYGNLKSLWFYDKKIQINADTSSYPSGFDIPLDTTGTFYISAQIKLSDKDQSVNPYITAYFFNPQNDIKEKRQYFKKTPIFKSDYAREYQIYEKNGNPALTHLFFKIPEQENSDSIFYKSLTISNISVSLVLNDTNNAKSK